VLTDDGRYCARLGKDDFLAAVESSNAPNSASDLQAEEFIHLVRALGTAFNDPRLSISDDEAAGMHAFEASLAGVTGDDRQAKARLLYYLDTGRVPEQRRPPVSPLDAQKAPTIGGMLAEKPWLKDDLDVIRIVARRHPYLLPQFPEAALRRAGVLDQRPWTPEEMQRMDIRWPARLGKYGAEVLRNRELLLHGVVTTPGTTGAPKPIALVLGAKDDWNGALSGDAFVGELIEHGYHVLYFEVGDAQGFLQDVPHQLRQPLEHAQQAVSFLGIMAHGDPTGIWLVDSGGVLRTQNVDDCAANESCELPKIIAPGASIVFDSCSVGDPSVAHNLAAETAHLAPKAHVWAAPWVLSAVTLRFDPHGFSEAQFEGEHLEQGAVHILPH